MKEEGSQCDSVESLYDATNVPMEFNESGICESIRTRTVVKMHLEGSPHGVVSHKLIPTKINTSNQLANG